MTEWIVASAAGAMLAFYLTPIVEEFCIGRHEKLSGRARGAAVGAGAVCLAPLPVFDSVLTVAAMTVVFIPLFIVSLVDLLEFRVPDRVIWPSTVLSLTAAAGASLAGQGSGIAALIGSVAFVSVIGLCHVLRPEAMGLGDVKLAVFLGLVIGFHAAEPLRSLELIGWTLAVASLLGIGMAAVRRSTAAVPFAPALAVATWGVSLSTQLVIR